ncbi:unnamed protein product [Timema podura]|uniref:RNA helicase n=1 Tax=Timema podura TaxID=61482 RepID=A0ABN7PI26_TIMPD|nr:unnamed protein product [Timema podura]
MEHLKISQPLCFNVKAFGDCWKGSKCPNRHFISLDLDHGDLPDNGEVKVKILHIHSAQCFSVRLLEHKGKNGVMTPIPNSYWNIAVDLNKLFRDPETRSFHTGIHGVHDNSVRNKCPWTHCNQTSADIFNAYKLELLVGDHVYLQNAIVHAQSKTSKWTPY